MKVILVTGGAGFIGSNFIKYFLRRNKNFIIITMDKLTYAGSMSNLKELEGCPRYHFIKGDICNSELVDYVLKKYRPSHIINFAAESHTDKSIYHPTTFMTTNIMGTLSLLESARFAWGKQNYKDNRFIQISTDEVYGSAENDSIYFLEESPLAPNNPYSASKASADLIIRAYAKAYDIPAIITRSCNNYGPSQNPEKFIPKCITNALQDKPIPLYGDGSNIREWIYVLDNCVAIIRTMFYGKPGEIYNIGSGEKLTNAELAKRILKLTGKPETNIEFVNDRPAHDARYSLNSYKARNNLSWSSKYKLEDGLKETVQWYKSNKGLWVEDKKGDT